MPLQCKLVDGHCKGMNHVHSAIVLLIKAKWAQFAEDVKGKGQGKLWETMLSPKVLKEV